MIGFIGGGNMGEAIIKGILHSKKYKNNKIIVSDISETRLQFLKKTYNILTSLDNKTILKKSSILILSVKPQIIDAVLDEIKTDIIANKHLIISIAAGVPISRFENIIGTDKKIVRVMPNACAFTLSSMSALSFNKNITSENKNNATSIFNSIGETIELNESQIDAVTALSGSGPGFAALIFEAFSDAGVNIGLPRDIANKLLLQTFKGTINLSKEMGKSFIDIKNMVTSPGGTTIAGIHKLEEGKLKAVIMNAVKAAYDKSKKFSE